jgi:D-sedoheptulose 7-phosphate isomerase
MSEKESLFERTVRDRIERSITLKQELLQTAVPMIGEVSARILDAYRNDRAVYWFGNGGSAADAQHLACELVNRFYLERRGMRSQAFTVNTSILTAVSNDYSYESVFAKQVEAFAREGDVLIGISTSGNARNVVSALKLGKNVGTLNVGLTGRTGGAMRATVDYLITVPSDDTPFIQECHILIGHIICYIVEQGLFAPESPR